MRFFVEQLTFGLTNGAIYALIALGYTMVYGIIELINFAHGDIFTVGGFFGLTVIGLLGLDHGQQRGALQALPHLRRDLPARRQAPRGGSAVRAVRAGRDDQGDGDRRGARPQPRPLFRRVPWSLCARLLSQRLPLVAPRWLCLLLLLAFFLLVCHCLCCLVSHGFGLSPLAFSP